MLASRTIFSESPVPLGVAFVTVVALVSLLVLNRSKLRGLSYQERKDCAICRAGFGYTKWRYFCDGCKLAHCHQHCSRLIIPAVRGWASDKFVRMCDACYVRTAGLDLKQTADVYEPTEQSNPQLAIVLHGAACTRKNLLPQVRSLFCV
jgi:hypothetical protein